MLTLAGFPIAKDGYGIGTIKIRDALQGLNKNIEFLDLRNGAGTFGEIGDRSWRVDGDTLALCVPDWLPYIRVTSGRLIAFTMFEATRLPRGWVELLNTFASIVLVPCEWNATIFRANGVVALLRVVKWGVDTRDYYPLERVRESGTPYTFLWSGTPDQRKGWDIVYRAFWQAFRGGGEAKLILHFRAMPRVLRGCDDANVEIVSGLLDIAQQRELLKRADCYVFPSRGEGWGSPPREAAATGLPTIATRWGGLAEDIEHWAMPIGISGTTQANYGFWDIGEIGMWAEPNLHQVAERMRWCFEHRARAAEFGQNAARWLGANATWEHTAREILRIVNN